MVFVIIHSYYLSSLLFTIFPIGQAKKRNTATGCSICSDNENLAAYQFPLSQSRLDQTAFHKNMKVPKLYKKMGLSAHLKVDTFSLA
jgi:hypothetical protein